MPLENQPHAHSAQTNSANSSKSSYIQSKNEGAVIALLDIQKMDGIMQVARGKHEDLQKLKALRDS